MSKPDRGAQKDIKEAILVAVDSVRSGPDLGLRVDEAWHLAASYAGEFVARELFKRGLIDRKTGREVIKEIGGAESDADRWKQP